jgi:hypothetical protein
MSFSVQRLLGGSAIGLEYDWHENEAVGVAFTELLLSVLQVVTQPVGDAWMCAWRRWRSGVPMVGCRRHTGG